MPRLIVTTDPVGTPRNKTILLDEEVLADHLEDQHSAVQILERLEWALRGAPPGATSYLHVDGA